MKIDDLRVITDVRGSLVPIEFLDLPFVPQRVFYVTDIPKDEWRGGHSKYSQKQYFICVKGQIRLTLEYGENCMESVVLSPGQGVLIEPKVWDSQQFLTGNDVAMVLCSGPYDPRDYILDHEKFVELTSKS